MKERTNSYFIGGRVILIFIYALFSVFLLLFLRQKLRVTWDFYYVDSVIKGDLLKFLVFMV